MDLNQRKLTKSEWESIEIPVSEGEKEVLTLMIAGYHDVNIKKNKFESLFAFLKVDYGEQMEDHLYNRYFLAKIREINAAYPQKFLVVSVNSAPSIKKADIIRIEKNTPEKVRTLDIYEYLLLDITEKVLKYRDKKSSKWLLQYFTLYKLSKNNIQHINRHIKTIVGDLLAEFEEELDIAKIIGSSVDLIEKNAMLLKYADMVLYEHQKQLFTIMRSPGPKLVLYIAPTGTGKTLSPIGLSENGNRIIFVCAARHVGLALARAAISADKKIAFAFGCSSAGDIRLHYFAAKEYTKNWKSGGIWKVDNSVGEKVEIMICDVKSYLPAMYYMTAFNPVENVITYWDEPTITMDYGEHELHEVIKKNWCENIIPNMILSSATLPKLYELTETIADFKNKYPSGNIHNIVSNDCRKTIPIINKNGYVVLPHYLSEDYAEILKIVEHCEKNYTLLRYFDLLEVVQFIEFLEKNNYVSRSCIISRHFSSLDDVNMLNIKIHYLRVLKNINSGTWGAVYVSMKGLKKKRIQPNTSIDPKGNFTTSSAMRRISSIGPGVTFEERAGMPITKLLSEQSTEKKALESETGDCAIYVTTKDAHTLTDGPTIFLAENIEKIAKFCIQQANIPAKVMDDIMVRIEYNNNVNQRIIELEHKLEDFIEKNSTQNVDEPGNKKNLKDNEKSPEINKMNGTLDSLRAMIKSAELNETFIPNKPLHLKKWSTGEIKNAFTCEIDENVIIDIMTLGDVADSWKVLLLMGIGVFTNHESIAYTEIMKKLADQQKLYMIIASSDYIYGTNYQFCHGYISKDLNLTQEKMIQALGRIGRNNIQQDYSVRLRDDEQIRNLFYEEENKMEVLNMNRLFSR